MKPGKPRGPMPKWEPTTPPIGESFAEGIEKLLKVKPPKGKALMLPSSFPNRMKFTRSLVALFFSTLVASAGYLVLSLILPPAEAVRVGPPELVTLLVAGLYIWVLAALSVAVFVLPILAAVTNARRPALWVAGLWGGVASLAAHAVFNGGHTIWSPLIASHSVVLPGIVGGIAYAMLARRTGRAIGA